MADFLKMLLVDFWATIAEMSPYLLFGFFVAGLISVFISQQTVEKHLGKKSLGSLVKASVVGVPLPLCSCGVIPVAMSLRKHGASKGAVISFLLSTPQTGVDSIFVTLSLLGPLFAIFRPLAAFIVGILGGSIVDMVETEDDQAVPQCREQCCDPSTEGKKNKFKAGFKYGFITLPADIGRAMLLGILVAAFISAVVPDGYFAEKLGTGIFAMVVMMMLGIPVYVCATASVPVAAALILKGLTPGAALVFLMTGPATNAASFATIWKVMGKKTAITYLLTVAFTSLMAGLLLDRIAAGMDFQIISKPGWMLPDIVKHISAIAFLAVLAFAFTKKKKHAD